MDKHRPIVTVEVQDAIERILLLKQPVVDELKRRHGELECNVPLHLP